MSHMTIRIFLLFGLFWTVLMGGLFAWEIFKEEQQTTLLAQQQAMSVFQQVVATRAWNAGHGGVYVPVTNETRPNPYLDHPYRDLESRIGLLTMINPAYMTRQVAEIAQASNRLFFHITSLNPIRPGNEPDPWEERALLTFDQGRDEAFELLKNSGSNPPVFRYMAPLTVKESCLPCHEKQGYRLGEIKGGISVTLDAAPFLQAGKEDLVHYAAVHMLVWTLGLAGLVAAALAVSKKQAILSAMNAELEHLATTDRLTRTYNRLKFEEVIEREKAEVERHGEELSAVLLDVDDFKAINDTRGHKDGDEVLKELADLLKANIRKMDTLFRWGGEEFFILCPRASTSEAVKVAEKLRTLVEDALFLGEVRTTISLGVSTYHAGEPHDQLIRRADQAMYKAKKKGRNRVEVVENST